MSTRREILQRLLKVQEKVNMELINPTELGLVRQMLENDCDSKNDISLKKYLCELHGKKISVISDFNLIGSTRKRLGSLSINGAKLLAVDEAPKIYGSSKRIMYLTE